MSVWKLKFFELGSQSAYDTKFFYSREAAEVALRHYLRLGGDDILKVISPKDNVSLRSWLVNRLRVC
jgi:hypothetical protein